MIHGQWFSPGKDISLLLPVRESVFGRSEDLLDSESWNVLVFEDNVPAASGWIWYREGRGRHLGDLVLRLLLFKAQSHSAPEVRLRCPSDVTGFFSRLGFSTVSAESEPVEMAVDGTQIDLDSCRNCLKQNCPNRR